MDMLERNPNGFIYRLRGRGILTTIRREPSGWSDVLAFLISAQCKAYYFAGLKNFFIAM